MRGRVRPVVFDDLDGVASLPGECFAQGYQDGQNPRLFIELFSVPSWEEHLRQHRERQTATDLEFHDAAAALSDPPAQTSHYMSIEVSE
jgi:hypothetical protein